MIKFFRKTKYGIKIIQVDDDTAIAMNRDFPKWQIRYNGGIFYVGRTLTCKNKRKTELLHRKILNCSNKLQIDHIDGNGLNNCRVNLRACSHAENLQNQKLSTANTSGYKGIGWDKVRNKWISSITLAQKKIFLGRFDCKEKAKKARDTKENELFGIFKRDIK